LSILLDTNACIAAFNGTSNNVRRRLDEIVTLGVKPAVSSIAIFELRYGVAKSARVESNSQRLDVFLRSVRPLVFDEEDARFAGLIRATLKRSGRPIGPYDLLIAGQALRHDLMLITANVREFSRVPGLRWEDWSRPL
jgi:tRNA(fMet)-specific endonuclease VapC